MIHFASDLHIEFRNNYNYIYNNILKLKDTPNDILLLLGDTFVINNIFYNDKFFDLISSKFKDVYLLLGNHEFYNKFDISQAGKQFYKKIRNNVHLVNNFSFYYNKRKIILSTFFSHINPENEFNILNSLNDFKHIYYNNNIITIKQYNEFHKICFEYIKNEIEDNCIIGTHHVPTELVINPEYKNDSIREAFVTEYFDFIYDNNISYWLYGHNHYTNNDKINNTIIKSNQLGYNINIGKFKLFDIINL